MVRRKGLTALAAAAAICAACKPGAPPPTPAEQKIRATVVTIRTTLQPQNKTFTHSVVIAGGRARSGDQVDNWRLFDLRGGQVTFVDDVAKTVRRVPIATLIDERRKELAKPLPLPLPSVEVVSTGAKRVLQGVETSEQLVRLGGYQRRLWIGKHPSLPDELFAMTLASTPVTSPLAGISRAADEALLSVRGFPLADHAELPYGDKKMIVDRSVVKIEQRDVPATWLQVNANYKDVGSEQRAASRPSPP